MFAGEKTVKQISSETELSIDSTRDCLCALLQHDLVMEVDGRGGDASKKKQKILKFIGESHGDDAELLVQQMVLHGRVRLSVLERYMQAVDDTVTTEQVRRIFEDLLADHLVTVRLSPTSGAAQDTVVVTTESGATIEPFTIPAEYEAPAGKRPRQASAEAAGGSRMGGSKRSRLNSGSAVAADADARPATSDVYWVLNYRQFMRHFRNEWVIEHITKKIDRTAGDIVKALLGKDLLNEGPDTPLSLALTPRDIRAELTTVVELDSAALNEYLQVLVADSDGLITNCSPYYQVNLESAQLLAKLTYIRKVIMYKYDEESYRLFQLVHDHGHLEQKQLKDMALVGSFKYTKNVAEQDAPRPVLGASRGAKAREPRTFKLLVSVDLQPGRDMYYDVPTMLQDESKLGDEYLETKRKVDQIPADLEEDEEAEEADLKRAKEHRDELDALQLTLDKLEHAKLEVDAQLLIFRDFEGDMSKK
eukprot:gene1654-30859_t